MSTKEMRIESSLKKTLRARKKSKGKVSDETLRRVSLNALTSLGKEWKYFGVEDQLTVLEKFLKRVGKVGENYLGNAYKDKVVKNIHDFFGRLGKNHSTRNIQGLELVKAAVSGENLEPNVLRMLLSPTTRLEG